MGTVTANTVDTTNLNAGKADIEGTMTAGSVSVTYDATVGGNLSVTGAANLDSTLTVDGAATVNNTLDVTGDTTLGSDLGVTGTATVGEDLIVTGDATASNVTATGTLDVTGATTLGSTLDVTGAANLDSTLTVDGAATVNNTLDVTGDTTLGSDLGVTGTATVGEDLIVTGDATASNVTATGTLDVTEATTLGSTLNVTGATTLTGALTANGAATFTQGASMNNQKITNVLAGTDGTDAVNKDQLDAVEGKIKTYTAGDGIDITSDEISVKSADNNIVVDGTGVSLADDINVTSVTTTGAANVGGDLSVNGTTTLTGALTANGTATFTQGASMNNQKITGVLAGTEGTDAVNKDQLDAVEGKIKTYTAGDGIDITSDKISVKAADTNIKVDGTGVALADDISVTSITTSGAVTVGGDLGVTGATTLGSTLNVTGATTLGDLTTSGTATFNNGASMNNQKITGVATGVDGTDAVNVNQLNDAISKIDGKVYTEGNGIEISEGANPTISAKAADNGNIKVTSDGIDLKDDISLTSVTTSEGVTVGGALQVTGATTLGSTLNVTGATTLTGALTANGTATFTQGASMNGQKITGVATGVDGTDAVNVDQLNNTISQKINEIDTTPYTAGDGIAIDEADNNKISVKKGNGIDFDANGNVVAKAADGGNIVVNENGISLSKDVSGLTSLSTDTLTVTNNATVGGALTAASVTAAGGFTINDSNSLTSSGLTIGGTQYITSDGLSAGGNVITNVKDGVDDNDAVNVSQLKEVKEVSDLAVTYTPNTNKSQVYLQGTNGTTITNVAAGNISSADSKDAVNGGQLYATNQIVGDGDYSSNNFLTDKTEYEFNRRCQCVGSGYW